MHLEKSFYLLEMKAYLSAKLTLKNCVHDWLLVSQTNGKRQNAINQSMLLMQVRVLVLVVCFSLAVVCLNQLLLAPTTHVV